MTTNNNASTQRKTLASQLDRLDGILDVLGDGLNEAVAQVVEGAVTVAVREGVQAAVVEVLTNPELLRRVREAAIPPEETPPVQPAPPTHSGWPARLGLALAAAGVKARGVLAGAWARAKAMAASCKAAVTSAAVSVARNVRAGADALMAQATRSRGSLATALGVGAFVGAGCYFGGPLISAAVSGIAAGVVSLGVAAWSSLGRLFAPSPAMS